MRAYLTRLLGRHWTVRTTADGEEALAAVAERAPDIVLTDVMMPRVDGFELLRRLRADAATRDIPVIMLTARAGQEASVEGLEAGADDYLAKPFRADELIARVRVALERAAGAIGGAGRRAVPDRAAAPVPPAPIAGSPRLRRPASRPVPAGRAAAPASARAPGDSPARHAEWRFAAEAASSRCCADGCARCWRTPGSMTTRRTTCCWPRARRRRTRSSTPRTRPSRSSTSRSHVDDGQVRISVRDYGQWRERMASMDRGRGRTLMSAFGEITATPEPRGHDGADRQPADGDRSADRLTGRRSAVASGRVSRGARCPWCRRPPASTSAVPARPG